MITFNILAWDNIDPAFVHAQRKVLNHLNLDYKYTFRNLDHGQWIDSIIQQSGEDVVAFLDVDAIPLNIDAVKQCIDYIYDGNFIIGNGQVSNHIPPAIHRFVAPSFCFINRHTWLISGKPSAQANQYCDILQYLTYHAQNNNIPYKIINPAFFQIPFDRGTDKYGSDGQYGIGTTFAQNDTLYSYHLFQSRTNLYIDKFISTCNAVVHDCYNTEGLIPCF